MRLPPLMIGLLVLIACICADYGMSYDEAVHVNYGDWLIAWFASGGAMDSAVTAESCKRYGGAVDLPTQLIANAATLIAGLDPYPIRHAFNALLGAIGMLYLYRLGNLLGGAWLGTLAFVMLLLTPRWLGHLFDNPKDIPFAAAHVATLFYLARPLVTEQAMRWSDLLKASLAIGLALGIRIGGVLLLGYAAITLGYLAWRHRQWLRAAAQGATAFLIAYAIMLLCWPYAALDPLQRPWEVLQFMSHNPWGGRVLLGGELHPATNLPWHYLPQWLLIGLPEGYAIGLACAAFTWSQHRRLAPSWALVAIAVLLPATVAVGAGSSLYDGLRHLLFIVPLLALVAAIGLLALWRTMPKWIAAPVVLLPLAVAAYDTITLHPYQTCYFNRLFAGGLAAAAARYDTDYWGQTYQEGARWILSHDADRDFSVAVPFMAKRLGYYFNREELIAARRAWLLEALRGKFPTTMPPTEGSGIRVVGSDWNRPLYEARSFRYYMRTNLAHYPDVPKGARLVRTIERQGTPLLHIYRMDETAAK